jgi:outer membrane protein assembly factor BamD
MQIGRIYCHVIHYAVLFGICAGILAGCGGSTDFMESQTDTELFEQGKFYYEAGEYEEALQYFLYVKENFVRSPYAGITRFYAGECYFAQEEYEDAASEYQIFLAFFPNDPQAPAAQYKIGVSYLKQSHGPDRDQTKIHDALTELQKVQENYPDEEEFVQKAEAQIQKTKYELALHELLVATFYRKEKHYSSSNSRLDYLLKEYPETNLNSDALFYKGLNYLDLEQPEDAKASFLTLIQKYPESQYVSAAQRKLEKLGDLDISQPVRSNSSETTSNTVLSHKNSSDSPKPQVLSLEGYVVTVRDNTIFTNLIHDDGIREGMVLEIYRNDQHIGTIRITEVHDGFSIGEIESVVSGITIQEEDKVRYPKAE